MSLTLDGDDVQVAKLAFPIVWYWPWPNNLGTQTCPRHGQDVPPCQKWSFFVNFFSYVPNLLSGR